MKQLLRQALKPQIFTYICFLALLLVPNNKAYLAVFFSYSLVLFVVERFSLVESLFATLLLSLPFERGLRGWFIEVVPPGPNPWLPGYDFYFGVAPKMIILAVLLLTLLVSPKKDTRQKPAGPSDWIFLIFLLLAIGSTLVSVNLNLAALGLVRLISSASIFISASLLLTHLKVRAIFFQIVSASLLTFGLVGVLQFVFHQPLGLFLEETGASQPLGYLTTDGEPFYRVAGLTGHPTFFGSLLSLLIPVGLGAILFKRPGWLVRREISILAVILGLVALFATFSRSGWLATAFSVFVFWMVTKHQERWPARIWPVILVAVPVAIVLLIYLPLFVSRVQTFSDILTVGNGRGRLNLVWAAWQMVKQAPLWGVGLNQFVQALVAGDLSSEARGFLFPVHNTFILFLAELGIPAGLAFVGFIGLLLWQTWKRAKKNWLSLGVFVAALTFLINAQFHTLFSQDPSFDLFLVYLAYLRTLL